nr:integrase, catalytic region, zinc finger, CCHC-type, peptidase aspartic, catalytic [Tanacetum cinerariifolium]
MESIHVNFDELPSKASVHNSTDPGPSRQTQALVHNSSDPALTRQEMALAHNSSDPAPTCQKKASVQISSDLAPEYRVMNNNSQGKKHAVEDHHSLNAKTLNVNSLVEIVLFIVDSGCSKHMTGNLKLLINFVEKFLGTVNFGNDQIAPILGYGDLVQGAVTIKRVYYVEGLNHNLFSIGQFCDADLEVSFRKSTCYIRDLKENDLLT